MLSAENNKGATLQFEALPGFLQNLEQASWYPWVLVLLLIARLVVMPVASQVSELAIEAKHAAKWFEYDLPFTTRWIRSSLLLIPLGTQYSLYMKVLEWFQLERNGPLMFIIAKWPLLSTEIFVGILLYNIVIYWTKSKSLARLAILSWLINPLTFWWGAASGHYFTYEICSLALSLYLALRGYQLISIFFLSISFTFHYYPGLLFPLYLLFFLSQFPQKDHLRASIKFLIERSVWFGLFSIVQLAPQFILEGGSFIDLFINSLFYHAGPIRVERRETALLWFLSWFGWPFKVLTGTNPIYKDVPWLFELNSQLTIFSVIIALVYLLFCFYKYFWGPARRNEIITYGFDKLLHDGIITLSLSLIFCGNIHYSFPIWLIFLYIIYSIISRDYSFYINILLLSIFSRYSFAFDKATWINIMNQEDINRIFSWKTPGNEYLIGFLLNLLLLNGLIMTILRRPNRSKSRSAFRLGYLSISVAALIILSVTFQAVTIYAHLAAGDLVLRQDIALDYLIMHYNFVPAEGIVQPVDAENIQAILLLMPTATLQDYREFMLRHIVARETVKQKFNFILEIRNIPEKWVKDVAIGNCQPTFLPEWEPKGYLHYDFARCTQEAKPEGIPVKLFLDEMASNLNLTSNVFAKVTPIPQPGYLPDKANIVNIFAIGGIMFSTLCMLPFVEFIKLLK